MKIAIISKPGKPELKQVVPELVAWLKKRGHGLLLDVETACYAGGCDTAERSGIAQHRPEMVIVLGGDGTLLAAARAVAHADIPILGVNLGSLGFLTEVPLPELYTTLEAAERNQIEREKRAMLSCEVVRRGESVGRYSALNDVVITKATIARMTEVDVSVDGEMVANYKADGVIVSTPTGSTAYSLAAGGPILAPSVDAFVITPVSPHALTNRPLVVKDSAEIRLVIRSTADEAYLTVDGQSGMTVLENDTVLCRKSDDAVTLLRLPGRTFFDVLRAKLKWGQR